MRRGLARLRISSNFLGAISLCHQDREWVRPFPRTKSSASWYGSIESPPTSLWKSRRQMPYTEYAAKHSAKPADINRMKTFAQRFHLGVDAVFPVERSIILKGTAKNFSRAFHVEAPDPSASRWKVLPWAGGQNLHSPSFGQYMSWASSDWTTGQLSIATSSLGRSPK